MTTPAAAAPQIIVSLLGRKTKTMSSCSTTMHTPSLSSDMTAMGVMGAMGRMENTERSVPAAAGVSLTYFRMTKGV